jgi:hypothetical protein
MRQNGKKQSVELSPTLKKNVNVDQHWEYPEEMSDVRTHNQVAFDPHVELTTTTGQNR